MKLWSRWGGGIALLVAVGVLTQITAQEPPSKSDTKADAKADKDKAGTPPMASPKVVKVEKGSLKATVTLKGIVEGTTAAEVQLQPKAWGGMLTVAKATEHGTRVRAGDTLVEFEHEKLDQLLKDVRQDRELAELALKQAELELPILEKQSPLELASAERDAKQTQEDLKRFLEVDRPQAEQMAAQRLKTATFSLEYARDELKQLVKMYKDKDLTEETEEMILKRHKNGVETSEFFLNQTKTNVQFTLKTDLPRREQSMRDAAVKAEISWAKSREILPLQLNQKRLALVKAKYDQGKAQERLRDLEKDRAALSVKATTDGIVYYGRYSRGMWLSPLGGLRAGSLVQPGEIFITIVKTDILSVRAEAEEKDVATLKPGVKSKAKAAAFPDRTIEATLVKQSMVPLGGRYESHFSINGEQPDLMPGMNITLKVVTSEKADAVILPTSSIFSDDEGETRHVYLVNKNGKPKKTTVKVGLTVGEKSEILDGVTVGQEILKEKP